MARKAQKISNLVIDEVSLVDKGANQHAVVTIAKSADGENKEKEMEFFDEQGNPLDVAALDEGDTVYDADGNEYVMALDEDQDMENEEEDETQELEPAVAKRHNPFQRHTVRKASSRDYVSEIREELSKALTDNDREEIIAKALGRVGELASEVEVAKRAAEQERTLRLEREYTEIAKSYNLPIEDDVLGGVLMRCAESLSNEDCEIISKCMEAAGAAVFQEYGYIGGGDNADVMERITEEVSKAGGSEEDLVALLEDNPELYDEYLSEHER